MRYSRFALAAGIIALTPVVVAAATITEPYSLTIPGTTGFNTTPFADFNPANGTLNEIMATLTGPGTVSGVNGPAGSILTVSLDLPSGVQILGARQAFTDSGPVTFDLSGSDNTASDIAQLIGTGEIALTLGQLCSTASCVIDTATLTGNITYDFTPAVTPEPGSLALLSACLAGLGLIRRRQKRRCPVTD